MRVLQASSVHKMDSMEKLTCKQKSQLHCYNKFSRNTRSLVTRELDRKRALQIVCTCFVLLQRRCNTLCNTENFEVGTIASFPRLK